MSNTFTVEFIGPPAAGKTTLSAVVTKQLREQGYTCSEPTRAVGTRDRIARIKKKLRLVAEQMICAPKTSFRDARAIHRTKQTKHRDTVRVLFNWLYVCRLYCHVTDDIAVFDQGVFQALWSIGFRSELPWEDSIRSVRIPETIRPDFVVLIRADTDSLRRRLGDTHDSETRVVDKNDIQYGIDGIDHIQKLLSAQSDSMAGPGYTTVDNSTEADADSVAGTVRDELLTVLDGADDDLD